MSCDCSKLAGSNSGGGTSATGNAAVGDVAFGKTFSSSLLNGATGTRGVAFELDGAVVFTEALPLTITCTNGDLYLRANNATSVTTTGATGNLIISATAATVVNLSSITTGSLELTVGNPTLTMPTSLTGGFTFVSTTRTSLVVPAGCTGVTINAGLLTTLTSIGTLSGSLTIFTLNGTGGVDQTGVNLILTRCAESGAACSVNVSGGTNAAPVLDVAATAASIDVIFQTAAVFFFSGNGSWFSPPCLTGSEEYYWFNVDGGNNDPAQTGTGHEVAVAITDDETAVASALAAVVNGGSTYVCTGSGDTRTLTRVVAGMTDIPASQDAGNDFTFNSPEAGTDATNAAKNTILANGGSVTTN